MAGRHEEAEGIIEQARLDQLQLGKRMQHAADSMDLAWTALLADRPEWAEPELREGAKVLEAAGNTGWLATVMMLLAEVLYRLEQDEEAEQWALRSVEVEPVGNSYGRLVRAKVLAKQGDRAGALRLSDEALEEVRGLGDLAMNMGDCLFGRGEVFRLLGDRDEARAAYVEALAVYERKGIAPYINRTQQALADLGVAA